MLLAYLWSTRPLHGRRTNLPMSRSDPIPGVMRSIPVSWLLPRVGKYFAFLRPGGVSKLIGCYEIWRDLELPPRPSDGPSTNKNCGRLEISWVVMKLVSGLAAN